MFKINLYKIFKFSLPSVIINTIINGKDKERGINRILTIPVGDRILHRYKPLFSHALSSGSSQGRCFVFRKSGGVDRNEKYNEV